MKPRALAITICFVFLSSLVFAQAARPQGLISPNDPGCMPSYRQQIVNGIVGASDWISAGATNYYWEGFTAGHSYSAEVWDPFSDTMSMGTSMATLSLLLACAAGPAYTNTAAMDPNLLEGFTGRISWIMATTGHDYQISLKNNDATNGHQYLFRITDTTLFSPRWSTWSGFLTQWTFSNVTKSDISGVFTIFNSAGTAIKVVNVTVSAGKVKSYSSVPGDLNLPANTSGSVMFAFVGPPGAIQADAAIMNSTVTVLAPVKFEPRNSQ